MVPSPAAEGEWGERHPKSGAGMLGAWAPVGTEGVAPGQHRAGPGPLRGLREPLSAGLGQ